MKWHFTPDEFIYVCGEFGADRFPAPLRLLSSARYRSEWEIIEASCRSRIHVRDDVDLFPVLRTIFEPETAIEVVGNRDRPIRAYGAVVTDIGVAVVQHPGATQEYGGDVTIQVGSVNVVTRMVAAVAGSAPAGNTGRMVETVDRLQGRSPESSWSAALTREAIRMRDLLAAPRTGSGHVKVTHTGTAVSRYASWFDVRNDGRYVYTRHGREIHIDPCGDQQFVDHLRRLAMPHQPR
ncbi:ESX secretion-associated protein EspG [Nocardia caishijiensis]|uniref:ESAT-6 protein secretion system EspG family protein n=1 Tax=Nocardia caishijiensis TaxID=184756 RepID=A0ABQ6YJQ0_9NOCA|nr:ESX secretion-associated protein EspG [Nocardia caishijiensis]KAF0846010.1 ESAT-6 protein secretion system EspG family protein [Nocardia caishijiensis]